MSESIELGPGKEFDIIRQLLASWGPRAMGIGDDAAMVNVPAGEQLVVSADSSVEHIHFERAWLTPREIGYRATMAALSDLAAMAAAPLGILLALGLPKSWIDAAGEIGDGVGDALDRAQTLVRGGDITGATDLTLALTVLGSTSAPLRRNGARLGDTVYVTGALGGPGAALAAWQRGEVPSASARERFAHPVARITEARWLARSGARAGIDISDGLLADAEQMATASGVRIQIDLERVPLHEGVSARDAAVSGEEYELIVCAAALNVSAFERANGVSLTAIGRVLEPVPDGIGITARMNGERLAPAMGFRHFS
ncbi:MAG TPA: thiamine-phosphate kinase [Gemmatimonadaceae bacterium]|nr:thiamine-phosphate kinase [Gemmatimonadaceae bacterium]